MAGCSYTSGQQFLRAIGLAHDGEAERIVEAVEKPAGKGPETGTATPPQPEA